MFPNTRTRALWFSLSVLAALFVATELTPRTSNSSRTFIGHIWTRLGLTGLYGSIRDGERAGYNEMYIKRTESGFRLLTLDELFSTYNLDRDQTTTINEFEPEYHVRAWVSYQWGGFVYKSWLRQEYSFIVADPLTGKLIDESKLTLELQLATADWLESGELSWTKWKAPRWPSDLRAGETRWEKTYPLANFWDALWCVLLVLTIASIGQWLRLEYRWVRPKQSDTMPS